MDFDDAERPTWLTLVGTGAGYGAILLILFLALFLVPYLAFLAL